MNNTEELFKQVLEEYENISSIFEEMKSRIFQKKSLVTRMARHPLFEIEPFEALLRNEFISDEQRDKLFIQNKNELNPDSEQLYIFTIDPQTERIYHRIRYDENNNCYETIFWYEVDWHKSIERYVHTKHPHHHASICYTFFKNGLPDVYIKCKYSEIKSKKYHSANGRVIGYHQEDTAFSYTSDVTFEYDALDNIDIIKEYGKDRTIPRDRPDILFKRPEKDQTIEATFKKIEDFLVTRIVNELLEHVRIKEEVYCLMLEYSMPHAFPPEIAIAVLPDINGDFDLLQPYELYNTPRMRYYSGENNFMVDLYEEKMEYVYLQYSRAYDYFKYNKETFEYWNKQIRHVYVNICKRIMNTDLSSSFKISKNYLVMARGDVHDDTEYYYEQMKAYKNNNVS